jgi:2-polyprenyl-3-methyl-5-hydroxy-6-metoxy-1,4-benzoquinol methylase
MALEPDVWPNDGPDFLVADIGCGTGRFLPILKANGYDPLPIDIADNCLDPDIAKEFTLLISPIAEIDGIGVSVDAAVCIDVMEHIPDELVDPTIASIAAIVKYGAVFGISNYLDDGKLHCSLHPMSYWLEKLVKHFLYVTPCGVTTTHPRRNKDNWFLIRCGK